MVQAGTGTGKSLAYLVPAALSGKKVVVATATKALQDQLAEKDLPSGGCRASGCRRRWTSPCSRGAATTSAASGWPRWARVGSRPSSATRGWAGPTSRTQAEESRWSRSAAEARAPEGIVEEVRQLVAWSQTSQTGDRADLSFEPSDRAWNMVSVGPRECPGAYNCPSGGRCFAEAARERASVGRRRGGEHPPLRRASGQRQRGAARARRGDLRRGPRARGGHDVEPRGGGDTGPLPLAR